MKTIARLAALLTMGIAIVPLAPHAQAQQHQSEAELANKLNNPVARSTTSVKIVARSGQIAGTPNVSATS